MSTTAQANIYLFLLTLKVTVQPSGKPAALASAMAASIFSSSVFWGFDGLDLGGIFAESTGRYHVSPKIVEGQTKAYYVVGLSTRQSVKMSDVSYQPFRSPPQHLSLLYAKQGCGELICATTGAA